MTLDVPLAQASVRPWPQGTGQDWFPVRNVEIVEDWSIVPNELHAGDIVQHRITVTARDALSDAIPDMPAPIMRGTLTVARPPNGRRWQHRLGWLPKRFSAMR